MLENYFFDREIVFFEKYDTSAPEWYIHIGHTSNTLVSRVFLTLMSTILLRRVQKVEIFDDFFSRD